MPEKMTIRLSFTMLFLFMCLFARSQNEVQVLQINKGVQYLSNSSDGNLIYQWNALSQNLEFTYEGLKSKPLKFFYREQEKEIVAIDTNEVIIWNLYNKEPKERYSLPKVIQSDLSNIYTVSNSFGTLREKVELHKDKIYIGISLSLVELSYASASYKILKEFENFILDLSYCESAAYLLINENWSPSRIHHVDLASGKVKLFTEGMSIYSAINSNGDLTIYDYFNRKGEIFSKDLKKKSSYTISDYVGNSKPLFINETLLIFPFSDSSIYVCNTADKYCSSLGFANGNGKMSYQNGYFLSHSASNNSVSCLTIYQFLSSRKGFSQQGIDNANASQIIKAGSITADGLKTNGGSYASSDLVTAFYSSSSNSYFGSMDGSFGSAKLNSPLSALDKISNPVTSLINTDSILYIGSLGRIVNYDLKKKEFAHTFRAHEGFVNRLSLSPDNKFLLSASSDGSVLLWNLKEKSLIGRYWFQKSILSCQLNNDLSFRLELSGGEIFEQSNSDLYHRLFSTDIEVRTRLGHSSSIRSLDINKTGDYLASVDGEGVIKVWLTAQMIPIHSLQFDDGVKTVKFIENGSSFFAFSGTCIYIIDTKSGELIRKTPIPAIYGNFMILDVTAANNGRFYLISAVNSNEVYYYNLTSNTFGWFCSGNEAYSVKDLAFHPSIDSLFVSYGKDGIYVMESMRGSFIRKIPNPNNSNTNAYVNYTLSFSPNGNLLLADYNDSLRVFDFKSGKKLGTYRGNAGFFKSDSSVFISGYFPSDQRTRYWSENVYTKKRDYEVVLDRLDYLSGEFTVDRERNLLYISKSREIKVINIRTGQFVDRQAGMPLRKIIAQFDPANPEKLIVSIDHEIKTVDAKTGKTEKIWKLKGDEIYFNADRTKFAISNSAGLNIYNASDEKLLFRIPDSDEAIFTNQGQIICFSYLDGLRIVKEKTGEQIYANGGINSKDFLKSFMYLPPSNTLILILSKPIKNSDKLSYSERIEAMKKVTYMMEIDVANGKINFEKELPVEYTNMLYGSQGQLAMKADFRSYKLVKEKDEIIVTSELYVNDMFFSDDGNYFYLTGSEGQLECYDAKTGNLLFKNNRHDKEITQLSWKDDLLLTVGRDGKAILMKANDGTHIGTYLFFKGEDHVMIDANNYYKGSKNGVESIYFKKGGNYFPIEQFDALQNRPDLVLKSFGETDEEILSSYAKAVEKRLNKLGIKQINEANDFSLPLLTVKSKQNIPIVTSKNLLSFDINGNGLNHILKSLHIWINDVPLYGRQGITEGIDGLKTVNKTVTLELTEGINKLQFALLNELGIESDKQTFYINYEPTKPIKKNLFLINLGVSNYTDSMYNLSYASKDAKDIGNLFLSTSSDQYDSIFHFSLRDKELTTQNVLELKKHLLKAGRNDAVIITFAGHGVLDESYNYYLATHDMDFNKPALKGLSYENLENLLDGISPLKKVLFIDACHSGEVDKEDIIAQTSSDVKIKKVGRGADVGYVGDTKEINATELSKELFNDLRRGTGATIVSASGGLESAIESDQWQNGLFTYCFLVGLEEMAADKNLDGKIMLGELQEYLQTEVYKKSNGIQMPTSRVENMELDWRVW